MGKGVVRCTYETVAATQLECMKWLGHSARTYRCFMRAFVNLTGERCQARSLADFAADLSPSQCYAGGHLGDPHMLRPLPWPYTVSVILLCFLHRAPHFFWLHSHQNTMSCTMKPSLAVATEKKGITL